MKSIECARPKKHQINTHFFVSCLPTKLYTMNRDHMSARDNMGNRTMVKWYTYWLWNKFGWFVFFFGCELRLIDCVKIQLHMLSFWNGLGNVDYNLNVAFTKPKTPKTNEEKNTKCVKVFGSTHTECQRTKFKQLQISIKWQNAFWRHIKVKMWHIS